MVVNSSDIQVVEGLVTKEYPYYLVYPTTVTLNNYSSYRLVKIYVSSSPITFSDNAFQITDGMYYEFTRSQFLSLVDDDFSGSFSVPSENDIFYTSADYAGAPSLNIDRRNEFNYTTLSALMAMVCLISIVVGRILVGGK